MKVFKIKSVQRDYNGNTTITHSGGAFHFREEDVALIEWTNNFRSKLVMTSSRSNYLFWFWVFMISFGLYYILVANTVLKIPISERDYITYASDGQLILHFFMGKDFLRSFINLIYFLPIFFVFAYAIVRVVYYFVFRDFFVKRNVFILLKNNQSIQFSDQVFNQWYRNYKDIKERDYDLKNLKFKSKIEYISILVILCLSILILFQNYYGKNSLTDFPNFYNVYSSSDIENLPSKDQADETKKLNEYLLDVQQTEKKYQNESIPNHLFFLEGILFPLKVFLVLAFVSILMLILLACVIICFGPITPAFNLFNRMLSDYRETYKLNKKLNPYIPLLWLVLFFELYYLLGFSLIYLASYALIAVSLEIIRRRILKKIAQESKTFFSLKYNMDLNFMNLYTPVLLVLVLWFVPVFCIDPKQNYSGLALILLFLPLALMNIYKIIISDIPKTARSFVWSARKKIFKNDVYIQKKAISIDGINLEYSSDSLKDNKRLVYKAVKNNALALQFASAELRNDKEIVMEALQSNKGAFEFASEELKRDPEILQILNENIPEQPEN